MNDPGLTERVEANLGALVDAANDGIVSAGASGRIIQFNKAAERMFGYSASEMIG